LLDLVRTEKRAYLMYQKINETPSECIQSFQAIIKIGRSHRRYGGEHVIQYLADLEGVVLTKLNSDEMAEFKQRVVCLC
jgi:hypothetical protein